MSCGRGLIALLLLWMALAAPLAAQPWPDTLTFERTTRLLLPVLYRWFNPEPTTESDIAREVEAGDAARLRGSVAS